DKDVHPTVIVEGYKKAADKAREILDTLSETIDINNAETLTRIAMTAMSTKGVTGAKDHLAKVAVDGALQVKEVRDGKTKVDVDLVKVLKKHGKSLEETELVRGIVIDKEIAHSQMPKRTQNAKIALLNAKLEIEKTEFDAKININSPDQMKLFLDEEERMLKEMTDRVAESGANFVFCEKSIDDVALHFLSKKGIAAVKNVSSGDMEKLAKATGAKIVASIKDLSSASLGEAKVIEESKIGDDKLTYVRDAKNPMAVTVVIRGGTEHVVDEAERSLHDALCVVRDVIEDGKILAGGGAPEAETAKQLRDYAVKVGGREQLAVEAFADAIESVPLALAENAGLDPIDVMVALRAKHEDPNNKWYGVDVFAGGVKNMHDLNVLEPLRVKLQVVKSATEAASMILRIDDVVASKGGKEGRPPMPPGGPGGMGGGDF
ncbi:MAG: thermosome subunit beta, partial [Candidatus Bathyarchaeia archaeon]